MTSQKTVKSLDKGIIECKIDSYLKAPLQPIQYASFPSTPSSTNQSITADEASSLSLDELNLLLNVTCNSERRHDFLVQITKTKKEIEAEKKERQRLQKHAAAQAKNEVVSSTAKKRQKEVIKDDKAKVSLGILDVGRIFKTLQTVQEPVTISDYNFSKRKKQKLIPLVYLTIDMNNSNNSLSDLLSMMKNPVLNEALKCKDKRSMSTLLGKLASIVLPIDHFGSYLDSSDNIIDNELANQNFCYTSERFSEEAYVLLDENDGFLLSATK
ncbi:22537_t:CDS:2, partial [Cetraspora pellucida]